MELADKPGIIIINDNQVIRTTKVKKYITKNKIEYKEVRYLENLSSDFKEVERSLKELENLYLGLGPLKEKTVDINIIDNNHYYCFWDKKLCGWYDSLNKNLSDYPFNDLYRFTYIGESENSEQLQDTHKRLFKFVKNKEE